MARKTVRVEDVVDLINRKIARCATREARLVLAHVAEKILMDSDQYGGFRYRPSEMAAPGVLRDDYDPTQVEYIYANK